MFNVVQLLAGSSCFLVAATVPKVLRRSRSERWNEAMSVVGLRPQSPRLTLTLRHAVGANDAKATVFWRCCERAAPVQSLSLMTPRRFAGQSPLPKITIDYP
jgi:hypothetical protein